MLKNIASAAAYVVPDTSRLNAEAPPLPERETLKLRLPNGLQALLVSDPAFSNSAVGLNVGVGRYHDPDEALGMAHLVEHLVAIQIHGFGREGELPTQLSQVGGQLHAETSDDCTRYLLSCATTGLEGVLARLAGTLLAGQFSAQEIARERGSVDMEYRGKRGDLNRRISLVRAALANPLHPVRRFSSGNAKSLAAVTSELVRFWFDAHYSPHVMNLVLCSNLSLEAQHRHVATHFSQLVQRPVQALDGALDPLSSRGRGRLTFLPLWPKEDAFISLHWSLPPPPVEGLALRPASWLANWLTWPGAGGLSDVLKRQGLANAADCRCESRGDRCDFLLSATLSPAGVREPSQVLVEMFRAIERLRRDGVPRGFFEELHRTQEALRALGARQGAWRTANEHCWSLPHTDFSTYPDDTESRGAYNAAAFLRAAEGLSVEACEMVLATQYGNPGAMNADQRDPYEGVAFGQKQLSDTFMARLAAETWAAQVFEPNPFACDEPLHVPLSASDPTPDEPLRLEDSPGRVMFVARAQQRGAGFVCRVNLTTPELAVPTAEATVLQRIYQRNYYRAMAPLYTFAEYAGLEATVRTASGGWSLELHGAFSKAPRMLEKMLRQLKETRIDAAKFASDTQSVLEGLQDDHDLHWTVFADLCGSVGHSKATLRAALARSDLGACSAFAESAVAQVNSITTVYGSVPMTLVEALRGVLAQELGGREYTPSPAPTPRRLAADGPLRVSLYKPQTFSSVALHIAHGDCTPHNDVCATLLYRLLRPSFFKTLRQEQQAGYDTRVDQVKWQNALYTTFYVQNARHSCDDVLARIEQFLESWVLRPQALGLDAEAFAAQRSRFIEALGEPSLDIPATGRRLHGFYLDGGFDPDKGLREAASALTLEDFQHWMEGTLGASNSGRLAVLVHGSNAPSGGVAYRRASYITR